MNKALENLIRVLGEAHGLDASPYDRTFLLKSVDKRLAATGLKTLDAYAGLLAGQRAEADLFFQSLHIGYSEFFRNPLSFALLEQRVLPALLAGKESAGQAEFRVWSAGCGGGQEALSVAILLDELSGARPAPLPYRIFATALSGPDLALARAGLYNADAVGNVSTRRLQACFTRQGDAYAIAPRLLERVIYTDDNLVDARSASPAASIYGDFDLVLCCNLLFYYQPAVRQRVLDKIARALAPGGYFVTGETEKDIAVQQDWLRAVAPPAAVYQKRK